MLSFKSPTLTALFNVSPSASFNATLVPSFFKPLSTFVICLSPALIPPLVTLGPPVIVKPPLFNAVSPIVTEPS